MKIIKRIIKKIIKRNDNSCENKAKEFDIDEFMSNVRLTMSNNNYVFNDNDILETPDHVFFYDSFSAYEVFEVFFNKDYEIFFDKTKNVVFFDIGMNMAASTLYFAKLQEVQHVYTFEPFKPTLERGVKNIQLNKDLENKITVFNYGLGKGNTTLNIPYNIEQSGCMSTTHNVFELNKELCKTKESIETIEIKDSYKVISPIIDKHRDAKLIIKIDTEGAEYDILQSLDEGNILNKFDIVMIEYHFKSPQELEDRLLKNGFVVFYKGEHKNNEKVGFLYAVRN